LLSSEVSKKWLQGGGRGFSGFGRIGGVIHAIAAHPGAARLIHDYLNHGAGRGQSVCKYG
jgi:hypothetical protein